VEWETTEDIAQVPGTVRVHNPNFNATVWGILTVSLQTKQRTEINHATNTKADDNATTAALRLHHRRYQVLASLLKVGIPRNGVNLVRDVVMFKKPGEDAAGAECIGFESNKDEDGW
jgi:hypothetical protein